MTLTVPPFRHLLGGDLRPSLAAVAGDVDAAVVATRPQFRGRVR